MVYYKRRFRKPVGRKKFYGRKKLTKPQIREVKSLITRKLEVKYIDCLNMTLTGIQNTGTITALTYPAQGISQAQRIGDGITIKSLRIRYTVVGYDSTNTLRIIVFKWMNDNAVYPPTVAAIVDNGWLVQDTAPLADFNFSGLKQRDFKICYNRIHTLPYGNTTSGPGNSVHVGYINLYGKKLHNGKLQFTTAAQTGVGIYYMLAISDSGIAGHPKVNYVGRMTYTDS